MQSPAGYEETRFYLPIGIILACSKSTSMTYESMLTQKNVNPRANMCGRCSSSSNHGSQNDEKCHYVSRLDSSIALPPIIRSFTDYFYDRSSRIAPRAKQMVFTSAIYIGTDQLFLLLEECLFTHIVIVIY
jgi:hypothetical protein